MMKTTNDTNSLDKHYEEEWSCSTWCSSVWRALIAEFISTSFLLFFGCMSCIPLLAFDPQPAMYVELTFGLTVMFNITTFGHMSGAHMNPAVTFASVIWGQTSPVVGILYMVAQCCGATLGYGFLMALSPVDMTVGSLCVTSIRDGLTTGQGFGLEVMLTAMLVFLNCGLWDPVNENKQDSAPLKLGLAVAGLSLAGGPLTGCSMNPARSLGPTIWNGAWTQHWVYWIGPFVGSAFAVIIYKMFLLKRKRESSIDSHLGC